MKTKDLKTGLRVKIQNSIGEVTYIDANSFGVIFSDGEIAFTLDKSDNFEPYIEPVIEKREPFDSNILNEKADKIK